MYHNNKQIYTDFSNRFEYFTKIATSFGIMDTFSLYVNSYLEACLCPMIDSGYNSGYQLAAWQNTNEEVYNKVRSNLVKLPTQLYIVTSSQNNYTYDVGTKYNRLISQDSFNTNTGYITTDEYLTIGNIFRVFY